MAGFAPLTGFLLGRGILATSEIGAARIAAGLTSTIEEATEAIDEIEGIKPSSTGEIMIPVSSSCMKAIGFRPADNIIIVDFHRGGEYTYSGSLPLFIQFLSSGSKGEFFNAHFHK